MRPFGALVFGRIGDLVGRKYAFMVTLLIMGGSTAAIGLLPGYATLGIFAPILLVTLRLLQGLALGGEYGGAAIYVAEHAPDDKRGFYTSFIQTTATLGFFVSLIVILVTKHSMTDADFKAWGWRIPFLLSSILVVVSYYIRARMAESPLFAQLKAEGKTSKAPITDSYGTAERWKMFFIVLFGATAGQAVVWYTGQFYALFFLQTILKVPLDTAYKIVAIALRPRHAVLRRLRRAVGSHRPQEDHHDRLPARRADVHPDLPRDVGRGATRSTSAMLVGLIFIQVLYVTMVYGPIAAFLVESFPAKIRYTSLSLPYHFGNGWFGGFTPVIATSIVAATGNRYAGLWFPIGVAAMTFVVGSLLLRETKDPTASGRSRGSDLRMSSRERSTIRRGARSRLRPSSICSAQRPAPAQGLHLGRHGRHHRRRVGRPAVAGGIRVRESARVDDRRKCSPRFRARARPARRSSSSATRTATGSRCCSTSSRPTFRSRSFDRFRGRSA